MSLGASAGMCLAVTGGLRTDKALLVERQACSLPHVGAGSWVLCVPSGTRPSAQLTHFWGWTPSHRHHPVCPTC